MGNQAEEKVENGEAERKNRSTGKATVRQDQEEGKGRNRGLSSQNRKRSGREEAEKKGSTGGTAVGAKPGRMKGNEQKAKYRNREGMHERSGRTERGKRKKRKRKTSTEEAPERQKQEERERKNRRLSSQNRNRRN